MKGYYEEMKDAVNRTVDSISYIVIFGDSLQ